MQKDEVELKEKLLKSVYHYTPMMKQQASHNCDYFLLDTCSTLLIIR